jgi:hypothetical protein
MFLTGDAQLRASSSCASPKKIFIGAHRQELSESRNITLTRMPSKMGYHKG